VSGKVLVDTNVVIGLFAGDPAVVQAIQRQREVFLCVPVMGELQYGARASSRVESNLARLDHFSAALVVLACDIETASSYAMVKSELREKGRPIPENDIWIASIARQHGLTLLTRDAHHFEQIAHLQVELV
jgi:tRNA(fMet)-specific endonuclease VapC